MNWRWLGASALIGVLACGELLAPRGTTVALNLVPEFDASGAFAANADRLHLVISRISASDTVAVKDTTFTIDSTGSVSGTLSVVVLTNPQQFLILLEAIRSADGVVLFSGTQVVSVTPGSGSGGSTPIDIPVTYAGPVGASVRIAPRDTVVAAGTGFLFHATVLDGTGGPVAAPVTYRLVTPGDSTVLRVDRLTGAAVAQAGATGNVKVFVRSPLGGSDTTGLRDTTTVTVGLVAATGARVTPGFGAAALGGTLQLVGTLIDGTGNAIPQTTLTWTSRTTGVATVDASGLVTGVAAGTAVIVGQGQGFTDSALVVVPPSGNVVASLTSGALRAFQQAKVGDTLVVTITADMRFTPSEKLGSYGDTLTWNPAVLQFIDVTAGTFAAPTVNATAAASGRLQMGSADASGNNVGQVVLAKVRFKALGAGSAAPALVFNEMSGQSPSFTNLFTANRITVVNGKITVIP